MNAAKVRTSIAIAMMIRLANPVWAEDVASYQASGNAEAATADPRTAALDDAFARAVRNALADLLPDEVRAAHQSELDREIISRARRWVTTFTVTKDDLTEGRRELMVAVQIDRDKIRARLAQLSVAAAIRAVSPASPTVTVGVRVTAPSRVRTSPLASAGMDALADVFRSAGFEVRRATTLGDGAQHHQDQASGETAGAEWTAQAEVAIGEPASIRGQAPRASLVTALVQLVENTTTVSAVRTPSDRNVQRIIAQQKATAAAPAGDLRSGVQRALTVAATGLLPRLAVKRAPSEPWRGDGEPIVDPSMVLVRIPPRTPYAFVVAEQKFLAAAKGIRAATVRRVSPSGWVIGVTTHSSSDASPSAAIERVALIATQPPANGVQISVKVVRGVVEVTLSGAQP